MILVIYACVKLTAFKGGKGGRLLNGKPPKQLVVEAHEKKVKRLLDDDVPSEYGGRVQ
jgi:hypothetical protein